MRADKSIRRGYVDNLLKLWLCGFGASMFFVLFSEFSVMPLARADIIDDEAEETGTISTKAAEPSTPPTPTTQPGDTGSKAKEVKQGTPPTATSGPAASPAAAKKAPPSKSTSTIDAASKTSSEKDEKKKKSVSDDSSKEPVRFTGGNMQGSLAKGQRTLELVKTPSKDLVVTQGDFRLESDKATVFFDKKTDDVFRIEAIGNVKIFKVDPETGKQVRAFAGKVVFFNNERKVVLTQNPKLWRGKEQQLVGKKITYELDTGMIHVDEAEGVMRPGEQ